MQLRASLQRGTQKFGTVGRLCDLPHALGRLIHCARWATLRRITYCRGGPCSKWQQFLQENMAAIAPRELVDSLSWGWFAHLGPQSRSPSEQASILGSRPRSPVEVPPLPQCNVRSPSPQFKDLIVVRADPGKMTCTNNRKMGVRSLVRSRATNGGRQLSAGLLGTRVPLCQLLSCWSVSPLTLATSTRESLNGWNHKTLPRQGTRSFRS